ncbi:MAG: zinc ribbon domain-containing protein [Clostridia bacterium]|nr:zinc ribbon domain-containing protein [Clostridia bacterium]
MPVLQYACTHCGKHFDELVKNHNDGVFCPDCGKPAKRLWCGEVYSATGKPAKKCSGNCKTCNGCR